MEASKDLATTSIITGPLDLSLAAVLKLNGDFIEEEKRKKKKKSMLGIPPHTLHCLWGAVFGNSL